MVDTRKNSKSTDSKSQKSNFPLEWEKIIKDIIAQETTKLCEKIQSLENEIELLKNSQSNLKLCKCQINSTVEEKIADNEELNISNSSTDTIIDTRQFTKILGKHRHKKESISTKNSPKKTRKEMEIVGTSKDQGPSLAADRRLWIYVGRCRQDLAAEEISSYLKSRSPGYHFEVEKLESKGKNSSFKVGASFDLRETLYEPSYWPENIVIKRFRFFRQRARKTTKND